MFLEKDLKKNVIKVNQNYNVRKYLLCHFISNRLGKNSWKTRGPDWRKLCVIKRRESRGVRITWSEVDL